MSSSRRPLDGGTSTPRIDTFPPDVAAQPTPTKRVAMTHSHIAATAAPTYSPSSDRDLIPKVPPKEWSRLQLLGFRFLVIYFLLYSFPGPIAEVPYLDIVQKPFDALWGAGGPGVVAHVLRIPQPISLQPSGTCDKLFDWVQVFSMLVL